MKINDPSRISQINMYQQNGRVNERERTVSAVPGGKQDGVSISSQALDLARELQEGGPERDARIASIKQAIQDGTYQVSTDAVVKKMLAAYGN